MFGADDLDLMRDMLEGVQRDLLQSPRNEKVQRKQLKLKGEIMDQVFGAKHKAKNEWLVINSTTR